MEPKTKIQKAVHKIQSSLKPITEKQKEWAYSKSESFSVVHQNKFYCLECGHINKLEEKWEAMLMKIENRTTCPVCKATAKPHVGKLPFRTRVETFEYLTTHKNWQVIRIAYRYKHLKKGQPASVDFQEVIQHWINDKGDIVSYAKPTFGMSRYIDHFILNKPLSLRSSQFKNAKLWSVSGENIYPRSTTLGIVKRNGYTNKTSMTIPTHYIIPVILKNSAAETLIKAKQFSLLQLLINSYDQHESLPNKIKNNWSEIKIALRNNYMVKDAIVWTDYIDNLKKFNKDTKNAKFVCPVDLQFEHNKYLKKLEIRRRKEKLQKQLEKINEDNKAYILKKKVFLDLFFKYDNISIQTMQSVHQIFEEGDKLAHCVFANEYYKKENTLLLSAKVNGEVVETVEVSLDRFTIIQSRGMSNHATEHTSIIETLVNNNMKEIKKRCKLYKKQAA
jgi:hypothetical protein